jgi:hypothetical protein
MDKKTQPNKLTFALIQIFLLTLLIAGATKFVGDHPISTIFKAGTEEKQIKLSFHPQNLNPEPGESVNITPFLDAKAKKPGFITLVLRYDSVHLIYENSDSTHLSDKFEAAFPIEVTEKEINGKKSGIITMSYAIKDPADLPGESIELSRLTFKVAGRDKTSIAMDSDASQIILVDQDTAEIIPEHATIDSQEKPTQAPTAIEKKPTEDNSVELKPTAQPVEPTKEPEKKSEPTPVEPTLETQTLPADNTDRPDKSK